MINYLGLTELLHKSKLERTAYLESLSTQALEGWDSLVSFRIMNIIADGRSDCEFNDVLDVHKVLCSLRRVPIQWNFSSASDVSPRVRRFVAHVRACISTQEELDIALVRVHSARAAYSLACRRLSDAALSMSEEESKSIPSALISPSQVSCHE